MRNVITQSVVLPAPAEMLFEMYLESAAHAAITGRPVKIAAERGSEFRAFDGQLTGHILAVTRPGLIVQSWRSTKFHDDDPDSTLILAFSPEVNNSSSGRIDLVHMDVPDHDSQDVTEGWSKYYWIPWRMYIEQK